MAFENISETDKAYLAGIIDGEGYLGVNKVHPKGKSVAHSARLCVYQNSLSFLENLKIKWGLGSIKYSGRSIKPGYAWVMSSKDALSVLEQVKPYLTRKQLQADGLIELELSRKHHGKVRLTQEILEYRDWIWTKIKELNQGVLSSG